MDTVPFVFPNDLDRLTMERLGLSSVPEEWKQEESCYAGRVSNVNFCKPGQMVFFLDGRKSRVCYLTDEETGWLDCGMVTTVQLACHYAASRFVKFSRNSVQKTLFD